MRKLQSGKYFTNGRPEEGKINYLDGEYWFVTNVEPAIAVDEYGNDDPGFSFEARIATNEEVQAWQNARRAARRGRSIWQMLEEETSDY